MTFGKRIHQLRIRQGLSQEKLAELAGYSGRSMISRIESDTASVAIDKVPAFAKALHTSAEYLLGLSNNAACSAFKRNFLDWFDANMPEKLTSSGSGEIAFPFLRPSNFDSLSIHYETSNKHIRLYTVPFSQEIVAKLQQRNEANHTDYLRDIRLLYGVSAVESNKYSISGPASNFPELLLRLAQAVLYLDAKLS